MKIELPTLRSSRSRSRSQSRTGKSTGAVTPPSDTWFFEPSGDSTTLQFNTVNAGATPYRMSPLRDPLAQREYEIFDSILREREGPPPDSHTPTGLEVSKVQTPLVPVTPASEAWPHSEALTRPAMPAVLRINTIKVQHTDTWPIPTELIPAASDVPAASAAETPMSHSTACDTTATGCEDTAESDTNRTIENSQDSTEANSDASWLEDHKESNSGRAKIVCIDGVIGVGKTTLLDELESRGYHVFREDLDSWQGILELFYRHPERWSQKNFEGRSFGTAITQPSQPTRATRNQCIG